MHWSEQLKIRWYSTSFKCLEHLEQPEGICLLLFYGMFLSSLSLGISQIEKLKPWLSVKQFSPEGVLLLDIMQAFGNKT